MSDIKIGSEFTIGSTSFTIDKIDPIDPTFTGTIRAMKASGKDLFSYYASKTLKSGKKSKQCGWFIRFTESGNFTKVL